MQALHLPTVININPRSLNDKIDSFKTYMEEEQVDLACISESHEREEGRGKGGRPALVVSKSKFEIQNLTNTLINIPWGVEAVWALLKPRNISNNSAIQRIVVCSFYNRNKRSKFKTVLLNHITEAFQILSTKYTKGLHFILGADANHLKLDTIISLRPDMRCVVEDNTRLGLSPPLLCSIQ